MPFFSRRRPPPEPSPLPYDPRSPEGLAARWVRWVAAAPKATNPIADPTGALAAVNQPDDVWFLAGSYGRQVVRSCDVPAGRELFVPTVNMWVWPAGGPQRPMAGAVGTAVLDGAEVPVTEVSTPVPFLVHGAPDNGVTFDGKPHPVTVWGLWAHLPGLAPGDHHLRLGGGDGDRFSVDVTYRLRAVAS